MTHEEQMTRLYDQYEIVNAYLFYLKGKKNTFPYSRQEFKKALMAMLSLAKKHIGYYEYIHNRRCEKEAQVNIECKDNESRDLIPPFNK